MVILDELANWDHTVLVPLDLLVDVERLQLGQDLNHSLLHPGLCHQRPVVWGGKPLLSDPDAVDRPHPVPNLVVLLGHELSSMMVVFMVLVLEDENLTLLSEVDLVERLNAWVPRVKVVVEVRHVLVGQSVKLSNLQEAGNRLLEGHLVRMVHFHQDNVGNIDSQEGVDGIGLDFVTLQEVGHQREVANEHKGVPGRNPPVDSSALRGLHVEVALDEESREGTLLTSCLNTNIGHTKENTVDDDKALGSRVGESQQCGIHSIRTDLQKNKT